MKIGGSIGHIANETKKAKNPAKANLRDYTTIITGGAVESNYTREKKAAKKAGKEQEQKDSAVQVAAKQAAERQQSIDPLRAIAEKSAPVMKAPEVDPTFRNAQMDLLRQLQGQANGTAPSLAQMQQKQASNKAMQNTLGAIRSGIGSNAALGARTAALAGGNQMADLANQSAMLRLKEQQDAMNAIAGVSGQGRAGDATTRGQDIGVMAGNNQAEMQQRALGAGAYQAILNSNVGQQEGAANRAAAIAARPTASKPDLINQLLPVAGSAIGAIYGGPAGAVAGGAAGSAASSMMQSNPQGQQAPYDDAYEAGQDTPAAPAAAPIKWNSPADSGFTPGASLVAPQRQMPPVQNHMLSMSKIRNNRPR